MNTKRTFLRLTEQGFRREGLGFSACLEVIPEVYSGKLFRLQITDFGTSLRLFFRPSRLSRDGLKNEPCENPKSAIFAAKAPPPNKHLGNAKNLQTLSKLYPYCTLSLPVANSFSPRNRYK